MGSWNLCCPLSNVTISPGDQVAILVYQREKIREWGNPHRVLPVVAFATYDDYGRFEDLVESPGTKALEAYLGAPFLALTGASECFNLIGDLEELEERHGFAVLEQVKTKLLEYDIFVVNKTFWDIFSISPKRDECDSYFAKMREKDKNEFLASVDSYFEEISKVKEAKELESVSDIRKSLLNEISDLTVEMRTLTLGGYTSYGMYRHLFLQPFYLQFHDRSILPEFDAIQNFLSNMYCIGKSIEPYGHNGTQCGEVKVFRLFMKAIQAVSKEYYKKERDNE